MDVSHVAVFGQTSEGVLKLLDGALYDAVFVVIAVGADDKCYCVVHGYSPSVVNATASAAVSSFSAMNFSAFSMSH